MHGPAAINTTLSQSGPRPALSVPAAWTVALVAVPLLAAFYLFLPTDGPARTIAYPVLGSLGTIGILLGIHIHRPERLASWRLVATAFALITLGDVTYTVMSLNGDVPYPSYADVSYLAGYVCLILGFIGLIGGRVSGGDRTSTLDALVLAAGAGSLFWITIVLPTLTQTADPLAATVSLAYPFADLVLLTLGLRVLIRAPEYPRYLQFFVTGIAIYFAADVVYALLVLQGTYVDGNTIDAGWIVGILLIAVAALHPSTAQQVTTAERTDPRISRARFALLAVAALTAPVILSVRKSQNSDDLGLIIEWVILFGLVLVRLATTVEQLAVSLRERRRLQSDLAYAANHDALTKLGNRLLFERRLGSAMAVSPATTALILMDLDDFKSINDTLGHPTGDEVLKIVGSRIVSRLRDADVGARMGGDEFAVVIEDCADVSDARAVAERAVASLRDPFAIADRQLLVHASAGVAIGRAGATPIDLMREADIALYRAKALGKNQVETYEAGMRGQASRSYELRQEMAHAMTTDGFVVHYQPTVQLSTGMIVGAEALVRWTHPVRGLLLPGDFMPEAEASGLIYELGRQVLRQACAAANSWPDCSDKTRPAISVNLAASQLLHPSLVQDVKEILVDTGLPPGTLVLEITEGALIDMELAGSVLERLRALGVLLALDDFGTGYSALSYLARLPLDIVKIDKAFVAGIGRGRRVDALLDGIVRLCHGLGLATVAEGVETHLQLDRLRSLGCLVGQGYLYSKAVPNDEFLRLLAAGRLDGVEIDDGSTSDRGAPTRPPERQRQIRATRLRHPVVVPLKRAKAGLGS